NKYYIGLTMNGTASTFILFRPKRGFIRAEVKISDPDEWKSKLEEAGLSVLPGGKREGRLHFQIYKNDLGRNRDLLKELFAKSFQENT
ncbi:MAG: hypothetical protein K6U00_11280, partial [Armatimonadetes bacterium]|nr:hypothetical protein [Armatimonadota bacterium]